MLMTLLGIIKLLEKRSSLVVWYRLSWGWANCSKRDCHLSIHWEIQGQNKLLKRDCYLYARQTSWGCNDGITEDLRFIFAAEPSLGYYPHSGRHLLGGMC